jgi:hypothetical protein
MQTGKEQVMFGWTTAVCGLGFLALASSGSVWAAVPINTVRRWQESAPEAVSITVLSVNKASSTRPYVELRPNGSVTTLDIAVNARVDLVHRTESGLAPQEIIIIRYHARRYEPVSPPGGNYGLTLNVGQRAKAYLRKTSDNTFELAYDAGCLEPL